MKLRIRKTGEVLEDVKYIDTTLNTITIQYLDNGVLRETRIKSLLDIEEVKDHEPYFITEYGGVFPLNVYDMYNNVANVEDYKKIGNYFETKEEAEKAVEHLCSWKRLKDKGFVFKGINMSDGSIKTGLSKDVSLDDCEGFYSDMELLFGGIE